MKIIHLLKHCNLSNGHVHVVVDLACEQAAKGHDVIVVTGGGAYVSLLQQHGVRHLCISQSLRSAPQALGALSSLIRKENPTVVHAHMMGSAAMAYAVTRFSKTPLITTMHNSFDKHSFLMRLGDIVVAVSNAERDLLLARRYNSKNLRVVYNGPVGSVREALNCDDAAKLRPKSIISVSGLHRRKRIDFIIEAFAKLADEFHDWHLVVVGDGPDMQLLRRLSCSLGVESRVCFFGHHPNPLLLMRQAEIFVNFSEAEPFGLAVAEARAGGCAVIVADVGGMPEVVENGQAGIIIRNPNPDSIAHSLRELLSDPAKLADVQSLAKSNLSRFCVSEMSLHYEKIYSEATSRFDQI